VKDLYNTKYETQRKKLKNAENGMNVYVHCLAELMPEDIYRFNTISTKILVASQN
jgi:sortase (surface protein transpeptidase)